MRLNACFNEMTPFRSFAAIFSRVVAVMAEMGVRPQQEEMPNPQGMKVFAVERPELPKDFVYFPALCGVQSLPLVFALNLPSFWGPLHSFTCLGLRACINVLIESVHKICRQNLSKIKLCDWPNKLDATSWQVLNTTKSVGMDRF